MSVLANTHKHIITNVIHTCPFFFFNCGEGGCFNHHSQLCQAADPELVGLELDVDLALGRDASDGP